MLTRTQRQYTPEHKPGYPFSACSRTVNFFLIYEHSEQGRIKPRAQVGFLGVWVYRPLTRQSGGGIFFLKLHRQRTKQNGVLSYMRHLCCYLDRAVFMFIWMVLW
jgi:hypothetical protein